MKIPIIIALVLALSSCGGSSNAPQQPPSTLVSTISPQRGTAPDWLTTYGSATPAQTGAKTLSINQPGQVTQLLVTTGATVHVGQPILVFAVSPSARTGYQQAETAFRVAHEQRDTTKRLLGQQLATNDQMAQAEKAVADAQTALSALAQEGAGRALQTIRAPFSGIVTAIPVAQGDRTQPGAALATVARAGGIVVTVGIPPDQVGRVHPGQRARIQPLDGLGIHPLEGHVLRIDGALDPQTKLADVDIAFPSGALLSGAAAKVDIATGSFSGWVVPHGSVVTANGETHVFQIVGGKAKAVSVTVAEPGKDSDLATGPLDPNRPLIVDGAYQVDDGGAVRRKAGR